MFFFNVNSCGEEYKLFDLDSREGIYGKFVHMSPSAEMTMLIVLGERPDAHTVVLHPQFKFRMLLYFQVYASI